LKIPQESKYCSVKLRLTFAIILFNIFRRYRITYLEKSDCPDSLKHFWSGHAQKHISERYVKLLEEREYRLEWAERIGLGFKIPTSVGLPGLLRVVPSAA
jgi:hypothetical protein